MAIADRIARAAETDRASQEIIDKERLERLAKTERLRQARLAVEASELKARVKSS